MAEKTTIVSPSGVVSFPALGEPRLDPNNNLRYECSLLFSPEIQATPAYQAMKTALDTAIAAKYPSGVPSNFHYPLRGCETKPIYADRPGWTYSQYRTKNPVDCRGPKEVAPGKLEKIDPSDRDVIYAGCLGRVSFYLYIYEPRPGKPSPGGFLTLKNFQKTGDGERIGGTTADGEFGAVESDCWTGEPASAEADFLK